jgi:DNA modification methylase
MAAMPAESVDAIVTDPPYGLEFMGREWDRLAGTPGYNERGRITDRPDAQVPYGRGGGVNSYQAGRPMQEWHEAWAREALRVLKPGGHLLAFGGTRTYHRLTCAIEDAGFEIRDCLAWLYGSGFPKSLDVSKAIDRAAGAEREVVGPGRYAGRESDADLGVMNDDAWEGGAPRLVTAPATPEAEAWAGWGTALKPAHEPVVVARKPLRERTVAAQVLATGTGGLNIDACRIEHASDADLATSLGKNPGRDDMVTSDVYGAGRPQQSVNAAGRWPANVALDEEAAARLDAEVGERPTGHLTRKQQAVGWHGTAPWQDCDYGGDTGGPSRFFYTAKASTSERDGATHPTVKPLDLMRWLVRLVTPPGGVVLDCFAGSGTTLLAAKAEGFRCIGIERDPGYAAMAAERYRRWWVPGEAAWEAADDDDQLSLLGGAA